jgi:hypothetical protein
MAAMRNFIGVEVLFKSERSQELPEDLQDLVNDAPEPKMAYFQISQIIAFYPYTDDENDIYGTEIITSNDDCYISIAPVSEIIRVIEHVQSTTQTYTLSKEEAEKDSRSFS